MMAYGYAPQMNPTITRIIKRPLTEIEKGFASKSYKSLQRALRGLAVASIVMAVFAIFLPGYLSDWAFSFVLTLLAFIIGALAIGMSVNALVIRQKITDLMKDGTAIEVQAPAYKGRAVKNMQS